MAQWCRNQEQIIPVVIAATFLLSCTSAPKTTAPRFPLVPGLKQRQVQFQQVIYPFYVFVPSSLNGTHSAQPFCLFTAVEETDRASSHCGKISRKRMASSW